MREKEDCFHDHNKVQEEGKGVIKKQEKFNTSLQGGARDEAWSQ